MNLKLAGIAIITLAALGAAACTSKTTVNAPGAAQNGITVTGSGQAFGSPDIAVISLGVHAQAANVADARETAANTAQAVIDSVKKNGVADKDIQTTQFTISPQYDTRTSGSPVIRGYQVTNILTVKVRKIDTTGKILDDATAAGGNNTIVQSVSFTMEDPSKLREAARSDALKDAKARADQLAKDAGVSLGKPISITENVGQVPVPAAVVSAPRAADSSTPVQTGELQVNVTVTVVYAID